MLTLNIATYAISYVSGEAQIGVLFVLQEYKYSVSSYKDRKQKPRKSARAASTEAISSGTSGMSSISHHQPCPLRALAFPFPKHMHSFYTTSSPSVSCIMVMVTDFSRIMIPAFSAKR